MSSFSDQKRRLRARSEHVLRVAAMEDVARRYPSRTVKSALADEGAFWRYVFVPLFRRVPWSFKRKAMRALRMTARNWPEDARRFGEPWRPPLRGGHPTSGLGAELPQEAHSAER
jgi:hypothetical protein